MEPAILLSVLVGVVIVVMIVLFVQTADVRWVIANLEKGSWTPDACASSNADKDAGSPKLRAFGVVLNAQVTSLLKGMSSGKGTTPSISESVSMVCPSSSSFPKYESRSVTTKYRDAYWLVLRRSFDADALFQAAVKGNAKYVVMGGFVYRLLAVDDDFPDLQDVAAAAFTMAKQDPGASRIFVIAAAYDIEPVKTPDGMCMPSPTVMPLWSQHAHVKDMLNGLNPRQNIGLHLWAYGW